MTAMQVVIWWSLLLLGLLGSALYSGLETGAYSMNRVRLQILDHRRFHSARVLHGLLKNPVTLLSTLLIGNNVANYLGTMGMAVILEDWGLNDWQVIIVNVLIVTPLLLVFGETLPKDLFSAHSDKLMYRFAWFLEWSRRLFTWVGVLPAVRVISQTLSRLLREGRQVTPFHARRQVQLLVKEGVGHGVLSDEQSAIVERVLALSSRTILEEAVPWKRVMRVRVSDPPAKLWELADRTSFSRFPVVDDADRPVGLLSIYDALLHTPDTCPPVRELMKPLTLLDAKTALQSGLAAMQAQRVAMVIVMQRRRAVGVVTVKDLVEPITGELASW